MRCSISPVGFDPFTFVQASLAMRQFVETQSYGSDFTAIAAPSLAVFSTLGGL